MQDRRHDVFLIGGAPGAGKTTLGAALAVRLRITSVTMDDLITAAIAVTTPETHPGLHIIRKEPHLDYYTNSSVDQLIADAKREHKATRPIFERIVRKRARQKKPIVIDGWSIRPSWVAQMTFTNVWAGWIVPTDGVLKARERKNVEWIQGSADPERMLNNFLARSYWYNNLIKEEAKRLGMNILPQNGKTSVNEMSDLVFQSFD